MHPIDFQPATRLVFGAGTIARLGQLVRELGAERVLVVSDSGVVSAGHFAHGVDSLVNAGLTVESFLGVRENPSTLDVNAGLEVAQSFKPDLLVGLGGGSSMDCAKGINFIYSRGGRMEDYWGVNKGSGPMLPMIAVPTTAGTGSEAQSFALITQAETGRKMACGDRHAACRVALLDPELTVTQPPRVTSLTGIDAISHAVESYVCTKRNALSACYSRHAWQLLTSGFERVLDSPNDIEARGQVQLGAFFAGMAIETSMLGAAHAMANPLTSRFRVTHGQAVGLMLPHVLRFNGPNVGSWYDELWSDVSKNSVGVSILNGNSTGEAGNNATLLAEYVRRVIDRGGLETNLTAFGVTDDSLDALAEEAAEQWTGTFNPRGLTKADFRELYHQALIGG